MSKVFFTLALSLVTLGFGSAQLLEGSDSLPLVVAESDNAVQEVEALVRSPAAVVYYVAAYNTPSYSDDPPEEQELPPVIDFGNGGMRYGSDGPGVRAVNTLVNFRGYTCQKVGCISVRPKASFPLLDNDYFNMYAIFTMTQPGIGPEDVIYFKSGGTLVPELTSILVGDEYSFIYSSADSFDIDDTKQDRQTYIMCFDLPKLPEVSVQCRVEPDE